MDNIWFPHQVLDLTLIHSQVHICNTWFCQVRPKHFDFRVTQRLTATLDNGYQIWAWLEHFQIEWKLFPPLHHSYSTNGGHCVGCWSLFLVSKMERKNGTGCLLTINRLAISYPKYINNYSGKNGRKTLWVDSWFSWVISF